MRKGFANKAPTYIDSTQVYWGLDCDISFTSGHRWRSTGVKYLRKTRFIVLVCLPPFTWAKGTFVILNSGVRLAGYKKTVFSEEGRDSSREKIQNSIFLLQV